jgi:hypothetical protein
MYTVDIINVQGKPERVIVNKDRVIREAAPKDVFEIEELVSVYANKPEYKRTNQAQPAGYEVYVITESVNYASKAKHVPVYKRKAASEYVAYADGTYDYNEVVSQDFNEDYFDFSEYRKALNM